MKKNVYFLIPLLNDPNIAPFFVLNNTINAKSLAYFGSWWIIDFKSGYRTRRSVLFMFLFVNSSHCLLTYDLRLSCPWRIPLKISFIPTGGWYDLISSTNFYGNTFLCTFCEKVSATVLISDLTWFNSFYVVEISDWCLVETF